MIVLRGGAATSTGRVRSNNQDSYLLVPDHDLFVVADGIGGNQGGEVASQMAVEIVGDTAVDNTQASLVDAVSTANRLIYGRSATSPDLQGMGTTLVAIQRTTVPVETTIVDDGDVGVDEFETADAAGTPDPDDPDGPADPDPTDTLEMTEPVAAATNDTPGAVADREEITWVNVGDSRVYLLRDGEIVQLSRDHSLVEELVREGAISEEEARTHPRRNIITRSLGVDFDVRVDLGTVAPFTGDRFLLCSDGLSGEITDDQIASVLRRLADPDEAAAELVRLANEAGGRDNTTVVIVDVEDDGGRAEAASAALADEPLTSGMLPAPRTMRVDDEDGTVHEEPPEPVHEPDDETVELAIDPIPDPSEIDGSDEPAARSRRPGWRVIAFMVTLVAIVGATVAGVGWTARNSWFVGYDDADHVTLYRGRPGGILFYEPEAVEVSDLRRSDVADLYQRDLERGKAFPSERTAIRFLRGLEEIDNTSDTENGSDDGSGDEGDDTPATEPDTSPDDPDDTGDGGTDTDDPTADDPDDADDPADVEPDGDEPQATTTTDP